MSKLTDEGLQQLLAAGVPVTQIALLCRTSVEAIEAHVARLEKKRREEEEAARRRFESATSGRPFPPGELTDSDNGALLFRPAHDLWEWVRETFFEEGAVLLNEDHWHLRQARIGMVWTNFPFSKQGKRYAGTCDRPRDKARDWGQAQAVFQLEQWFGTVPHFRIILDAGLAAQADNASFCALVEHELYHAAQLERDGEPQFNDDDEPLFTLRGHDFEGFLGVSRRYGVGKAEAGVADLARVAQRPPLVAEADIAEACGTCLR